MCGDESIWKVYTQDKYGAKSKIQSDKFWYELYFHLYKLFNNEQSDMLITIWNYNLKYTILFKRYTCMINLNLLVTYFSHLIM